MTAQGLSEAIIRSCIERAADIIWDIDNKPDMLSKDNPAVLGIRAVAESIEASLKGELDRLTTPPAPQADGGRVPERETWWLVERKVQPPQYVRDYSTLPDFTTDPWRAYRFKTEREAFDFRLRLETRRDECKETEHVFINKRGVLPYHMETTASGDNGGAIAGDRRTEIDIAMEALEKIVDGNNWGSDGGWYGDSYPDEIALVALTSIKDNRAALRSAQAPAAGDRYREGIEAAAKRVEELCYAPFIFGGDLILDADTLDAAAKAIRALASPPASEWRPIETAPKDGTHILAVGGVYHGAVFEACWAPSEFKPEEPWLCVVNGHRLPEHCLHRWMPMPSTPNKGSE